MKKKYVSPSVEVELFTLTQAIASCSSVKICATDSVCVAKDPDSTVEMVEFANIGVFMDGCNLPPVGMDSSDGICYNTNVNMAFTS